MLFLKNKKREKINLSKRHKKKKNNNFVLFDKMIDFAKL